MNATEKLKLGVGALGVGAAALGAWTLADVLANRGVERVPYTVVGEVDGVEVRRYPETVRVRTTAASEGAAFRRLFRYIDGENGTGRDAASGDERADADGEEIPMTAPVETADTADDGDREGESVSMTAPVRTGDGDGSADRDGESVSMTAPVETEDAAEAVTMSFFLPPSYTPETAPEPTDPAVELVVDPPRTMGVRTFSWWTPDLRVRAQERRLRETLEAAGIEAVGDPVLERYDAPFTPPFRRTNEVAVEVDSASVRAWRRGAGGAGSE